jgi:hypothetical protein
MIELICLVRDLVYQDRRLQPGDVIAVDGLEAAHLLQLGGVTPRDRCFMRKADYEAKRAGKTPA